MPNFFINVKEKGAKKAAGNIKGLTSTIAKMAAVITSATVVINGLKQSIAMAAEMEGVKRGFDNLAKSSGFSTKAFSKFKSATDSTIDSLTLMKQANNAMLLGITDSEDQMAQMFDVAQRLGQSLGIDTVQSIESLVTGLGRQSKLMLDNLGIMVDTNGAYEDYASSIGKTTSQLTDQERKTAFVNAAMAEANSLVKQLGEEQLTTKDALAQVATAAGDLAVIFGDKLGKSVRFVSKHLIGIMENVELFIDWADGMNTVAEAQDQLLISSEVLDRIALRYDLVNESSGSLVGGIRTAIEVLERQIKDEGELDKAYSKKVGALIRLKEELKMVTDAEVLKAESIVESDIRTESSTETVGGYLDALINVVAKNAEIVVSNNKVAESYKALQVKSEQSTQSIAVSAAQQGSAMINTGKAMEMASQQAVAAEIQKVIAVQIGKIVATVPFPFNIALAAAGGAAVGSLMTQSVRQFKKAATGMDEIVTKPTLILAGEAGAESVNITPLSRGIDAGGGGGSVTVNISGNVMSEEYVSGVLAEQIKEAIRRGTDFGVS